MTSLDPDHSGEPAPRRWWVAVLLFIIAACGYLYVGRPIRYVASLLYFVVVLACLFLLPGGWLSQPVVFIAACGVVLAIALAIVIDLIRLCLQQPDYQLRWYNRWWIYLAGFLIGSVLSFAPDILGGSGAQTVRTFSIPSVSSAPTLRVGDYILVNNRAFRDRKPSRGDVVVFTLPSQENVTWVKRIAGMPGDRVQMKNGELFINETKMKRTPAGSYEMAGEPPISQFEERLPNGRTYLTLDKGQSAGDNTPVKTVPDGHYFLLGDNRDNSSDSRFPQVGMVPRENIFGLVTGIIFADDLKRIGSRVH